LKGFIEGFHLGLKKEILEVNFAIESVSPALDQGCAQRLLLGKIIVFLISLFKITIVNKPVLNARLKILVNPPLFDYLKAQY